MSRVKSKKKSRGRGSKAPPPARPVTPPISTNLISILIIVLVVVIYFSPFLLEGKTIQAADTIESIPFSKWGWDQMLGHGRLPLWIPNLFSGMPSFGSFVVVPTYQVATFFVGLLGRLSWFFADVQMSHFWHMLLLGIGFFVWMRRKDLSWEASLLASLAFCLTPDLAGVIGGGHAIKFWTICYIPVLFLCLDHLMARPGARVTVLTGLVFAMMLSAKHVQIVYYFLLAAGAYTVVNLAAIHRRGEKRRSLAPVAAALLTAFVLGFLLNASLFLSIREYAPYSIRGSAEMGTQYAFERATAWSFAPREILTFLVPGAFGFGGETYWGPMPFTSYPRYVGVIVLGLAALALAFNRNRVVWTFAGLSLFALLVSFGRHFPPFYSLLYNYAPYFDKFRVPVMIQLLLEIGACVMAGYGLDWLLSRSGEGGDGGRLIRLARGVLLVGLGLVLLSLVARGPLTGYLSSHGWFLKGDESQRMAAEAVPLLVDRRADELVRSLLMSGLLIAALGAVVTAAGRGRLGRTGLGVSILALLLLDLGLVDRRIIEFSPRVDPARYFSRDSTIEFLQSDPEKFRIFPADPNLFRSNMWVYHDIETIGGYHPAKLKLYDDLLTRGLYRTVDGRGVLNWSVIRMLNVKYLLTRQNVGDDRLEAVHSDKASRLFVYRLRDSLARAWLVDRVEAVAGPEQVLAKLGDPEFDPAKTAIVTGEAPPIPDNPADGNVDLVEADIHRLEFDVATSGDRMLVISEIYYPAGWEATLDGEPVEIYRVNYLLRGVRIPSGEHNLVLRFRPPGFRIGLWLTLLGLAATVILLITGYRKRG